MRLVSFAAFSGVAYDISASELRILSKILRVSLAFFIIFTLRKLAAIYAAHKDIYYARFIR